MKRTTEGGVWVWFWPRSYPFVPFEIVIGAPFVLPDLTWGEPSARFIPAQCDIATHFNAHNIIFDLTFCVSDICQIVMRSLKHDRVVGLVRYSRCRVAHRSPARIVSREAT